MSVQTTQSLLCSSKEYFRKDLKMNIQSLCPYGMKSIMECISRAILLSQPTDIPGFLLQYLSELISFRESYPEDDPKIVTFCYQEMWGKLLFKYIKYSIFVMVCDVLI